MFHAVWLLVEVQMFKRVAHRFLSVGDEDAAHAGSLHKRCKILEEASLHGELMWVDAWFFTRKGCGF